LLFNHELTSPFTFFPTLRKIKIPENKKMTMSLRFFYETQYSLLSRLNPQTKMFYRISCRLRRNESFSSGTGCVGPDRSNSQVIIKTVLTLNQKWRERRERVSIWISIGISCCPTHGTHT
jgi:hypothetical protein